MKILYYDGGNQRKREQVEQALKQAGIPLHLIEAHQWNETLEHLLAHPSTPTKRSLPHTQTLDLMIFDQADDDAIQKISALLKKGDAQVACKCIVTPYNRKWTFAQLFQEITAEHEYMECRAACMALIQGVALLNEQDYTPASWGIYEAAFMKGYFLLQQEETSLAELSKVHTEMIQAKNALVLKASDDG